MVYDQDFSIRGEDLALAYARPRRIVPAGDSFHDDDRRLDQDGPCHAGESAAQAGDHFRQRVALGPGRFKARSATTARSPAISRRRKSISSSAFSSRAACRSSCRRSPMSENQIGSILGRDTIEQGSSVGILVAMGARVRVHDCCITGLPGLVASFALGSEPAADGRDHGGAASAVHAAGPGGPRADGGHVGRCERAHFRANARGTGQAGRRCEWRFATASTRPCRRSSTAT